MLMNGIEMKNQCLINKLIPILFIWDAIANYLWCIWLWILV